jgi:hypothetical protein
MARARPKKDDGSDAWDGALSLNPRGFGFVARAGHDDVYVPPEAIGPGMHGDLVTPAHRRGAPAARQERVARAG